MNGINPIALDAMRQASAIKNDPFVQQLRARHEAIANGGTNSSPDTTGLGQDPNALIAQIMSLLGGQGLPTGLGNTFNQGTFFGAQNSFLQFLPRIIQRVQQMMMLMMIRMVNSAILNQSETPADDTPQTQGLNFFA